MGRLHVGRLHTDTVYEHIHAWGCVPSIHVHCTLYSVSTHAQLAHSHRHVQYVDMGVHMAHVHVHVHVHVLYTVCTRTCTGIYNTCTYMYM